MKKNKNCTTKELKRLSRIFRDGVANLAIEGLHMSREDKAEVWAMYRMGLSSDEMVKILKENMGLK